MDKKTIEHIQTLQDENARLRAEVERLRALLAELVEGESRVAKFLRENSSAEACARLRSELAQNRAITALREHERDEARAELRTVAERQREACAEAVRCEDAGCRCREDICNTARSTPLVTEGTSEQHEAQIVLEQTGKQE